MQTKVRKPCLLPTWQAQALAFLGKELQAQGNFWQQRAHLGWTLTGSWHLKVWFCGLSWAGAPVLPRHSDWLGTTCSVSCKRNSRSRWAVSPISSGGIPWLGWGGSNTKHTPLTVAGEGGHWVIWNSEAWNSEASSYQSVAAKWQRRKTPNVQKIWDSHTMKTLQILKIL